MVIKKGIVCYFSRTVTVTLMYLNPLKDEPRLENNMKCADRKRKYADC